MDNYCIKIFDNDTCEFSFLKYNRQLIKTHQLEFNLLKTNQEKYQLLEKLWLTTLGAELTPAYPNWNQINFKNEKEKIMFLLRWQ